MQESDDYTRMNMNKDNLAEEQGIYIYSYNLCVWSHIYVHGK